jgi:hypothetical protein
MGCRHGAPIAGGVQGARMHMTAGATDAAGERGLAPRPPSRYPGRYHPIQENPKWPGSAGESYRRQPMMTLPAQSLKVYKYPQSRHELKVGIYF